MRLRYVTPHSEASLCQLTASTEPVRAGGGALRVLHRFCGILPIPVLHPLPHVAMHIVHSPGIGLTLSHGMGCPTRIGSIPGVRFQPPHVIPKTVDSAG